MSGGVGRSLITFGLLDGKAPQAPHAALTDTTLAPLAPAAPPLPPPPLFSNFTILENQKRLRPFMVNVLRRVRGEGGRGGRRRGGEGGEEEGGV